jgi:hypothetical protein
MRALHRLLPYLPFLVLALAVLIAVQHIYFYW